MADLVEVAAVRVKGGKITDRWSTFVNPGRPIVGNQMHGITDKDVKGAPTPAEAARKALDFVGDALVRRPLGGLRHRVPRGRPGRRHPHRAGPLPRHARDRPRGLPGSRELQARRRWPTSSGSSSRQSHRALPDAEATATLLTWFGNDLPGRIAELKTGIATAVRATRTDKAESEKLLEAARRQARFSKSLFGLVQKKTVRELVLAEGIRMDGRATDEIRPISVEVGLLPRAHGSGLFTRGQTQALTVATLGASSDVQRIDTISAETEKRYLHHYNFPPYSTGENKPMRGPSRRDIGHGNLAARALLPVLPTHEEFPYVIRLVSEVVAGNGSTSMASTCGSTLALMDAGVPISAPVAGAAMGLVLDGETGNFVVLTDILGKEDSIGDMDFKVTGTTEGITALQMDIKVKGIDERVIREGLKQALAARLFILDKMTAVLPSAREEMSDFAPRITTIKINPEKIREIIGKGGSMIRKIQEETSTEINVEDDGTVEIAAVSGENARKAIDLDREPHPRGRDRRAVPRQGHPAHDLRRLRRDPAGQGGPRPHRRARRLPRAVRRGRRVGRRRGHGGGHRDRPPGPRQPLPQGGDAAASRQVTLVTHTPPGATAPGGVLVPCARRGRGLAGRRPRQATPIAAPRVASDARVRAARIRRVAGAAERRVGRSRGRFVCGRSEAVT